MAMICYGINDEIQSHRLGTQNLLKAADELILQTERVFKAGIVNIVILC